MKVGDRAKVKGDSSSLSWGWIKWINGLGSHVQLTYRLPGFEPYARVGDIELWHDIQYPRRKRKKV